MRMPRWGRIWRLIKISVTAGIVAVFSYMLQFIIGIAVRLLNRHKCLFLYFTDQEGAKCIVQVDLTKGKMQTCILYDREFVELHFLNSPHTKFLRGEPRDTTNLTKLSISRSLKELLEKNFAELV